MASLMVPSEGRERARATLLFLGWLFLTGRGPPAGMLPEEVGPPLDTPAQKPHRY